MKPADNRLCIAVRMALAVGVFAVAGGVAQAQDTGTNQASPAQTQNLKGVVVTGSLIRRVDIETASPVITIGRQHIDDSGSVTLGSVLQELPSIAGNAINPQVTGNGGGVANATTEGGSGASKLSLRGLGDGRTLVLINGQRLVNSDINLIPQEMVSQVDALAEGATTTYGSDAIGGVVNILTRDNFEGAQVSVSDGISGHGDAKRKSASLVLGHSGDKYRVEGGLGINKTGTAIGTDRDFSRTSYSLRNGVITPSSGSTFVPHMRIQLPANLRTQFGCPYVTLAQPDGSHLSDYQCFSNTKSTYNEFPKYNYLQTNSLRRNGFFIGSYDFTPNITGFVNAFYVSTASTGLNAPDPTYTVDGWSVPASAPYNPFGVTFSGGVIPGDPNSGYEIRTRVAGNAPRVNAYRTETEQIITGLRGGFGDSSWLWNATLNYGHSERNQTNENEILVAGLQQVINTSNFFNQANIPGSLQGGLADPTYSRYDNLRQVEFTTNGNLWQLPAGTMQASIGTLYRNDSYNFTVPDIVLLDTATLTCQTVQEACASPGRGSDSVKEVFAETLIPVLADIPGAHSLDVDLGIRTSKYDSLKSATTNKKVAIQWRPIKNLLVRGTVSQVFRAPNLNMLYDGPSLSQPGFVDPCAALTAAELAQHAAACRYVPPNFDATDEAQVNALGVGSKRVGANLKPEHGKSVDLGLVYAPEWAPGVNTSVDFWHVYLYDTLVNISPTTIVNQCFNNNDSQYCPLLLRYDDTTRNPGKIYQVNAPTVNLGSLSTSGVDATFNYDIPHFDLGSVDPGNFRLEFKGTYVSTFNNSPTPGAPGATVSKYAGTFNSQFGNIARLRGSGTVNWNRGNWSAQWRSRYISSVESLNADSVTGASFQLASVVYHSLQVGYAVPAIRTRFSAGIDNISDRQPPFAPGGRGTQYDVIGRYFWLQATVKLF